MLLAADVAARALFQATDHDVIQKVGGGVELFSYCTGNTLGFPQLNDSTPTIEIGFEYYGGAN